MDCVYTKEGGLKKMVKLQENKNRWFITIPKEIVEFKKWEKGQELLVVMDFENNVQIKEAK